MGSSASSGPARSSARSLSSRTMACGGPASSRRAPCAASHSAAPNSSSCSKRSLSWPRRCASSHATGSPSSRAPAERGHDHLHRQNWPVVSPAIDNLVAQLTRLPGVGTRTAHRLAFHLLRVPKDEAAALATAIEDVKERVRFCSECGNLTEEDRCEICRDERRDRALVCVVEQPVDLISVERTHEYRGLYHVLGGALSPIDGGEPAH